MDGWIKSYRSVMDNPIVCKDADHYAVWGYILHYAEHAPTDAVFKGRRITLQPGQLITGRKQIASKFKIDENKVYRILKSFKIEQQIEQQTSNACSLISVINWGKYQSTEQQNEQQLNNDRTTSEQPVNTIQEVKKIRTKEYIHSFAYAQECVPRDFENLWTAFSGKRKSLEEDYRDYCKKTDGLDADLNKLIRLAPNAKNVYLQSWLNDVLPKSCAKKDSSPAFEKFRKWITNNAPGVGRMKEPFTEGDFVKLKRDFALAQIQEILKAMHNWKPLLTRNVNANLTFRRWAAKDQVSHEPQATTHTGVRPTPEITNDEIDRHCADRVTRRLAQS